MKKTILSAILFAMATTGIMAEEPAAEASHWTRSGNASLQFTQGYVSKNWYKGGVSSFSLLATGDYTFNYKYDKFTWDNKIEGKLGFINSSSQYRTFISNNDILKWTSKAGYEASKNWFYTLQAIGQTQFCTGWKDNGDAGVSEVSKFFNPAYLTISLGMDWKRELENIKWSVFMSPCAYNVKYVGDPILYNQDGTVRSGKIDGTQFGIMKNEYNAYDLGASAKATMDWKVSKYLTWSSQATYYSPLYNLGKKDANGKHHGYTTVEWENTFDMPLNKYFSTKIYTHLRFDDSVGPDNKGKGWGYFQFTELLSFGLSYAW